MTDLAIHIPTLRSRRLTLRAPRVQDADAYMAFYGSGRSASVGGPLREKEAWKVLTNDVGHWMLRGFGWWIIEAEGRPVGTTGFHAPVGQDGVEIGWTLFSGTGRGYATEAAQAALDWAGGRFGRLVSYIDRDNVPSKRVAARLGATDTGRAAAHNSDCTIWTHEVAA